MSLKRIPPKEDPSRQPLPDPNSPLRGALAALAAPVSPIGKFVKPGPSFDPIARGEIPSGTPIPQWFRRIGDVPGLSKLVLSGIDRTTLAGHDVEPSGYYNDEGRKRLRPRWPITQDGFPVSPAEMHASKIKILGSPSGMPADIVRNAHESLELPGEPSDYLHIMSSHTGALGQEALRDPVLLKSIEDLCWLGIHLTEAIPGAANAFNTPPLIGLLAGIYERQGRLD